MYGSDYVNYYATLTGGLLLLDKTLTEDADNIFWDTSVGVTGCAVYNQQNTSNQTLRGNFNATETEFDIVNRTIKYVYDFDTAEVNGTIASVALTHAYSGYSNRECLEEAARDTYPLFMELASGTLRLSGSNARISAYDRTLSYTTYGSSYKWIFLLEPTDLLPIGKKSCLSLRELEKMIGYDLDNRLDPTGKNMTVRELVDKYIATKRGVKNTTRAGYKTV